MCVRTYDNTRSSAAHLLDYIFYLAKSSFGTLHPRLVDRKTCTTEGDSPRDDMEGTSPKDDTGCGHEVRHVIIDALVAVWTWCRDAIRLGVQP